MRARWRLGPRPAHRPVGTYAYPYTAAQLSSPSRMMRITTPILVLTLAACASAGSSGGASGSASGSASRGDVARDPAAPPALAVAGDQAVLRRDLFAMAGDSMRGREAGTLDELRASGGVAERAREAGLLPAGDDGTYFQWWSIRRVRPSDASTVSLDGQPVALWRDAAIMSPVDARVDLPLTWIGDAAEAAIASMDLKGKAVAARLVRPARPPAAWLSLRDWRYARQALGERTAALSRAGAAAIVLVADDSTDANFESIAVQSRRGSYNIDTTGAATPPANRVPTVWLPK